MNTAKSENSNVGIENIVFIESPQFSPHDENSPSSFPSPPISPDEQVAQWFRMTSVGVYELQPNENAPENLITYQALKVREQIDSCQMQLGDLGVLYVRPLPHGQKGNGYLKLAAMIGMTDTAFQNWVSVASNVPYEARVDGLSFAHYRAVAPLAPDYDTQRAWLEQAKAEEWSASRLQFEIKKATGQQPQTVHPSYPNDKTWAMEEQLRDKETQIQELQSKVVDVEEQVQLWSSYLSCPEVAAQTVKAVRDDLLLLVNDLSPVEAAHNPAKFCEVIKARLKNLAGDLGELGN